MKNFNIDIELTASVIGGFAVILTGIVSLFLVKDVSFATTCIVSGSGLVGLAKTCNTAWDIYAPQPAPTPAPTPVTT